MRLAEEAAADAPENADALFALAVARLQANRHIRFNGDALSRNVVAARDLFDDAERFARDYPDLINLAELRLQQWDYPAAESLARRAMTLDPTQAHPFRILAECALAAKRPEEAYDLALEALRLAPGSRDVLRLLARVLSRRRGLTRALSPGVDWMVEMDRGGLVALLALMAALGAVFSYALSFDLARIAQGESPALLVSAATGAALLYALACYIAALRVRLRIRRDLKRIALPDF